MTVEEKMLAVYCANCFQKPVGSKRSDDCSDVWIN